MATQIYKKKKSSRSVKKLKLLPELADLPEPIDRTPIMIGDSSSDYRTIVSN